MGLIGLVVVSVQGIFSMHLLARLKVGCEAEHGTRTFVDVGRLAFGAWGAGLVRVRREEKRGRRTYSASCYVMLCAVCVA